MELFIVRTITVMLCIAMAAGAVDRLRGNRWHLGEKFDEGLNAFPQLLVVMGGILALIPLVEQTAAPALVRLCSRCGLEPASLPGLILANDMGAFHLAHTFTSDKAAADFGGMLVGGVIGVNLIFNIPVAVAMTAKEEHPFIIRGIFCGLAAALPGTLLGGLFAGNMLLQLLKWLLPALFFLVITGIFFLLCSGKVIRFFIFLGRAVGVAALIGICSLTAVTLTGSEKLILPLRFMPLSEILNIVGMITVTLPGAYVAAEIISRITERPLKKLGGAVGINHAAMTGMIVSLANVLPVFSMTEKMDPLGKVVTYAFLAGGSFALGDHLAFVTVTAPGQTLPLLIAKFSSAAGGAVLAYLIFRRRYQSRG